MNILAFDFGLSRIGVAVGSTESGIAFARDIIENNERVFDVISEIIDDDRIEKILLGRPMKRDGAEGDIEYDLSLFATSLLERSKLPIVYLDERYTTKIAQSKLREMGMNAKQQQDHLDSIAAQVMLQEWLEM